MCACSDSAMPLLAYAITANVVCLHLLVPPAITANGVCLHLLVPPAASVVLLAYRINRWAYTFERKAPFATTSSKKGGGHIFGRLWYIIICMALL